MGRRLKAERAFSLIETLVAITLITVGALALATTFVGAAAVNQRVALRQQALELARRQIDRLRSLDYGDVALFTEGQGDPDWSTNYCPLASASGAPACTDKVIAAGSMASLGGRDPRQPKSSPQRIGSDLNCTGSGDTAVCPSTRRNGIILYTYIYWNDWSSGKGGKQYKLITVVARFSDPKDDLPSRAARRYTSVTVTSIAADIPQVGQIR